MTEQKKKLTRQQKRQNAQNEAKRLAVRAGKNFVGVPRKVRRKIAFDTTKKQLREGTRKGTEYKSLEERFAEIGISKSS